MRTRPTDTRDYITQMALELARLAREANLPFLAYMLRLSALEAGFPSIQPVQIGAIGSRDGEQDSERRGATH